MNDMHKEFLALIDHYHLQDQATRIQKAEELEQAFWERLQSRILAELSEEQIAKINEHINQDIDPEELSNILFGMIEDVDTFVEEVFEEFKAEFLTNSAG